MIIKIINIPSTILLEIIHDNNEIDKDALPYQFMCLWITIIPTVRHSSKILCMMKMKEESEKVGLKLNIQKIKIMASSPITSWQIDGETMETVTDFIFLSSKITADGNCSHEIKRCLLLGRKVMINLDSILKSRDIPLSTKIRLVKAMVFPVVMYGLHDFVWTTKKMARPMGFY